MNLIISFVLTSKLTYKCTGCACELCPTRPYVCRVSLFHGVSLQNSIHFLCSFIIGIR